MARLTPEQWDAVKIDYEVHGLSYTQLVKKHNVGKSTISDRAKKENWLKSKTEQIVQKKVSIFKELRETEQQTEQMPIGVRKAIDLEVNQRLAQEQLFIDSAMNNQKKANEMLDSAIDFDDLNKHSQITARNKDTTLGKQPDTAIQINNNPVTPTKIERVIVDPSNGNSNTYG